MNVADLRYRPVANRSWVVASVRPNLHVAKCVEDTYRAVKDDYWVGLGLWDYTVDWRFVGVKDDLTLQCILNELLKEDRDGPHDRAA